MKNAKTVTIETILKELEEEKRAEVVRTIDMSMDSISSENIKWDEFEVFENSKELMKELLENLAVEYLIAVAIDMLDRNNVKKVKIAIKEGRHTSVWSTKHNEIELIAVVTVSTKRLKAYS